MPTSDLSLNLAKKVKIVNPIENGSNITSRKRALQFVEAKRAVFVGKNSLRFIEADVRNQAAAQRAADGYASVDRMMTKAEIQNIPLVRAGMAFTELMTDRSTKRVRHSTGGRSGPVRVPGHNGRQDPVNSPAEGDDGSRTALQGHGVTGGDHCNNSGEE